LKSSQFESHFEINSNIKISKKETQISTISNKELAGCVSESINGHAFEALVVRFWNILLQWIWISNSVFCKLLMFIVFCSFFRLCAKFVVMYRSWSSLMCWWWWWRKRKGR